MSAVTVRASGFGWRHSGRRAFAIRDLDLRVEPGERVLLLGPSGSGKSTLLAGLAGVLGEDEGEQLGELRLDGQVPRAAVGRAGLLLQDPDSQIVLGRIGDDVAFGCENLGVPRDEIWVRVRDALDAVGLNLPIDHPTSALSGGQKQRLALAGILAMRPGLILLDEPTANLDPDGVAEVRDAVARVVKKSGSTLIVIEHRVAVWQELADRVLVLGRDGRLLADGPTGHVLASRGRELAHAGIWVPGFPPAPSRRSGAIGERLLRTAHLVVGRDREHPLDPVPDFPLRAGALTAVTGPNGSGKSTLALTLGGLLRPVSGAVRADDGIADGAGAEPYRWRSRQLLSRIGSVFQDPEHQFLAQTVRDELAIGPRALKMSSSQVDRVVDEFLARLRLEPLARANPFTLSGGEKRRLSVGTALATDPRILILDEPTFGQDAGTWAEVVALLAERLDAGSAVAAVSHDAAFVAALAADRVELGVVDARETDSVSS